MRSKLERFAVIDALPNVVQHHIINDGTDFPLKDNWRSDFFKNDNPLILELGCGRGEYTVGLGEANPGTNYLGIDVKGDRIWKGASYAHDNGLTNIGFLRTQIDHITYYFGEAEVDEIWITHPDPQPKKSKSRKRLTSPRFLGMYRKIMKPGGIINFKTDNTGLYLYTKEILQEQQLEILQDIDDVYKSDITGPVRDIKTRYELMFAAKGETIKFIRFRL